MRKLSEERIKTICTEYSTGNFTIRSLSRHLNINPTTISYYIKLNNLYTREHYKKMIRKYPINENYFDEINDENKAYFLGFLYADGYNGVNKSNVIINLAEQDKELLEKFKLLLSCKKPLRFKKSVKSSVQNQWVLAIENKHISDRLSVLGCTEKKTFTITFPNENIIPKKLQKYFIRGYFDGDGCITSTVTYKPTNYRSWTVSFVGTTSFLDSLQDILKSELSFNKSSLHKRFPERDNNISTLMINGNRQINDFKNWLYDDKGIYLERKFNKFKTV